MTLICQLLLNGLVNGAMFAVLAISYGLIYRSTRVFHVAYGALFVASAYLLYTLTSHFHPGPWLLAGFIVLIMAVSGGLGVLVELIVYRLFRLWQRGSAAVLVASLGLGTVIEHSLAVRYGNDVKTTPLTVATSLALGPLRLTRMQFGELLSCAALLALSLYLVRRTRAFKFVWAMGDDPELFTTLGRPLQRYRALAFFAGTAMAALPACLIMVDGGVQPHVGLHYLLIALVGMLVGGADKIGGWVVGGFALAILQNLVVVFLPTQWMDLVTFTILILLMYMWPRGLFGFRKRTEQA